MTIDRAEMDRRWFAYFYDGDDFLGALVNKFGIRDPRRLEVAEYRIAAARSYEILDGKFEIPRTFDLEHYLSIHRALMSDVYPWAGTVRDVDLVKGDYHFATVDTIESTFARATELATATEWRRLPRSEAMAKLAEVYQSVNEAHPAREANGRATRLFMRDVAAHAGYEFHEGSMTRTDLIHAATVGGRGDPRPLTALFDAHCAREPSAAQQLAAASSTPPATTLRQRIERFYLRPDPTSMLPRPEGPLASRAQALRRASLQLPPADPIGRATPPPSLHR